MVAGGWGSSTGATHPAVVELLLWPAGPWPPPAHTLPAVAASAQAFGLVLADGHDPNELWRPLEQLLAEPKPTCLALELDPLTPPSPASQELLIAALLPWLQHPHWFAPWGQPLLLLKPLDHPTAQHFWLQRLRRCGAQLLELHDARPADGQADGVVVLHPHGEPPLANDARAELLALQSSSYGPLGPKEHRSVWLDSAIAWQNWRVHAATNTALHAHHQPGLVVLQVPPGQNLAGGLPPLAWPQPRSPLRRAVVLHAFHLELVAPILQRLLALLVSEGGPASDTELFVSAPPQHLAALQGQLAAAGNEPCLLAPEAFLWPVEVSMGPSAGLLMALLAEQGKPMAPSAMPWSACWG